MAVNTLREYTDLGLIHTLGRSPANYRLFSADALWCVRWIGELRGLGLTVAEIRELTSAWNNALQTLLVSGEPVTIAQLANQAGRTEEEIRTALAAMPDTEYNAQGRIIGFGLTFNPTPHRYETHGRTFYTWCALDTLVFPAILGQSAKVTSPCRATGEPVRLTATPDGPTGVEPATAVVSLVTPGAPTSVRSSFCNQSHFFTSAEAAKHWLAEHPDARVLPVADAYEAGRPLIEQVLSGISSTDCC